MPVEPTSQLVIAYSDHTLDATAITGTNWDATETEANVALIRYAKLALATNNSCDIQFDLGRARAMEMLAMPRHTLGQNATWRIRVSNDVTLLTDPGAVAVENILYDSTALPVWPSINTDTGWEESLENLYNPPAIIFLPAGITAQYVYLDFNDPDAANYTISKITISPIWRPTNGVSKNWTTAYKSHSKPSRTKGGRVSIESRARFRQMSFGCAYIPEAEALLHFPSLDKDYGGSNPFSVIIDPSDVANRHKLYIYGTNSKLNPLINVVRGYYSKKFIIDEWL